MVELFAPPGFQSTFEEKYVKNLNRAIIAGVK